MIFINKVILISGLARHGKDTVAEILQKKLGNTLIIANADYVKFIASKYFGYDGDKSNPVMRTILQKVGTEIIRSKEPDFWIDTVLRLIAVLEDEKDYFVVPDCRFENEIIRAKERYGNRVVSIKVTRPDFDNGLTEEQKNHPSEAGLKDFVFDYTIVNDGTLEDLNNKVNEFIVSKII